MSFLTRFAVPDIAIPVIADFVTPEELLLIEAVPAEAFTAEEARAALEPVSGESWPAARAAALLRAAYARGVLNLEDETFERYRIADFYLRLEVFALSDTDAYLALPARLRAELDTWCFAEYLDGLGDDVRPSKDRVVSLEETLAFIDANEKPIWLNRCDCRTLSGRCDKPTDVCVSFRNGINTLGHRGVSRPITAEEAKAIVRRADADGLMHTVNDDGICNCCSDCCYLFRAQAARGTGFSIWPLSESVVILDEDLCIDCEACVDRCPFAALVPADGVVEQKAELCRGCGLCVENCPTAALTMVARATEDVTP